MLGGPLGDIDAARRAYDRVAGAVLERIQQVDTCTDVLPELGMPVTEYQSDFVKYRKSFVTQPRAVMARVAELFRSQEASGLDRFLVRDVDEDMFAICAWCESVRDKDGEWIAVGHLVPREGFAITHGVCPTCAAAI